MTRFQTTTVATRGSGSNDPEQIARLIDEAVAKAVAGIEASGRTVTGVSIAPCTDGRYLTGMIAMICHTSDRFE